MNVAGVELLEPAPVVGGDICRAWSARTAQGGRVFAKTLAAAPSGFFTAEARGLNWLRTADGPPVPAVIAAGGDGLVLEWVTPTRPTVGVARRFGRALAALHASAAPGFGAADDGFIGSLLLRNRPAGDWAAFFAERRLRPFLAALTASQRAAVEAACDAITDLAGPPEPPARIHGDLWSGNLLWAADGDVWLVDAASAHGGHRETDLAMLQLFGAPHLDQILASYDEAAPLAEGWQRRVPLHQLHPLLVHATLFGGGYGERCAQVARDLLA